METRKFDWTSLYGELERGDYEFVLSDDDSTTTAIRIIFKVDDAGKVIYEKPVIR